MVKEMKLKNAPNPHENIQKLLVLPVVIKCAHKIWKVKGILETLETAQFLRSRSIVQAIKEKLKRMYLILGLCVNTEIHYECNLNHNYSNDFWSIISSEILASNSWIFCKLLT